MTGVRLRVRNLAAFGCLLLSVLPATGARAAGPAVTWSQADGYRSPGQRLGMNLVYDGATSQLLLFGGQEPNRDRNDTWEWDGGRWSELHPAVSPPPRQWGAAAYDPATGQVVLFGGYGQGGSPLADTWTWDGSTWTQAHPSGSPGARWGAALFYDPASKKVVLFGGSSGLNPPSYYGDTWTWDGTTWTQQLPLLSPPPREWAAVSDGAAGFAPVLFGGVFGFGDVMLQDTWTWDGASGTWTLHPETTGPAATYSSGMAYDPALGGAVMFGGEHALSGPNAETWLWDGQAWTQESPPTSPMVRSQEGMAFDPRTNRIEMYGGSNFSGFYTWIADTWSYDGTNWTEQDFNAPSPRLWPMAARSSDGQTVIFGGQGAYANALGDTWTWNGSWKRVSIGNDATPPPRWAGAMAYDSSIGKTLLFGGRGDGGYLDDTWLWSPDTGWQDADSGGPVARSLLSLAYDPAHQQVVLFGGCCSIEGPGRDDTWTWDPSGGWNEENPSDRPAERFGAVMAFDPAIGKIVLFGGASRLQSPATFYDDTWTWDGSTWTELHPAHSPPPREMAAMAYDPASGVLVLQGGCADPTFPYSCPGQNIGGQPAMGDTWTFDGTDWIQQQPAASPAARDGAVAVDGDGTTPALLFGGQGDAGTGSYGGNFLRDTWTWSGPNL